MPVMGINGMESPPSSGGFLVPGDWGKPPLPGSLSQGEITQLREVRDVLLKMIFLRGEGLKHRRNQMIPVAIAAFIT